MNSLQTASIFLISTLIGMYMLVLIMRILLQWLQVNYFNPITQFIVKLTDPITNPMRRIIPSKPYYDLASLTALIVIGLIQVILLRLLRQQSLEIISIFIQLVADLCNQVLNIFFYSILFSVIISWVNPTLNHPIINIIYSISEPLLRPFRRLIPPISGFDLSPIFALISLKLIEILFINQLYMLTMI